MIGRILQFTIRKDLLRKNAKHNHREYLQALHPLPKIRYWAGYHKKKLIFFALVLLISWTYEFHHSVYHYLLNLPSPKQMLINIISGKESLPNSIAQQKFVGWPFEQRAKDLLERLYYQADTRLIFGVGNNYMHQVFSNLNMFQKPEEQKKFWTRGGFYKKRNQLVSGMSLNQFLGLYVEGFKSLKRIRQDLTEQIYLEQFLKLFFSKAEVVTKWEKQFNRQRHGEFLKSLLTDNDFKQDEINRLMTEKLDTSQQQVEDQLVQMGMKGMSIRDKWLFWHNKEVLFSLRQYALLKKQSLGLKDQRQRFDFQKKKKQIQQQLKNIANEKKNIREVHFQLYGQEIL